MDSSLVIVAIIEEKHTLIHIYLGVLDRKNLWSNLYVSFLELVPCVIEATLISVFVEVGTFFP